MWNLSKNQAEANIPSEFIISSDEYPFRKMYFYFKRIIPTTIVKDKNAYEITYIHESYHLNGFVVTTYGKENLVICINVFGEHPNVDLNTNEYCLPYQKKCKPFDENFLSLFNSNLKTYYYDSAHFIPQSKFVQYKKMKSMYIQLNQGE